METCGEGPTTKNSNTYILSPSNVQKENEVFTVNCLIHEGKIWLWTTFQHIYPEVVLS